MTPKEIAAVVMFRRHVCEKETEIDPQRKMGWFDMSVGFFLGMYLTLEQAHRLALYVRYDCQYWANEPVFQKTEQTPKLEQDNV